MQVFLRFLCVMCDVMHPLIPHSTECDKMLLVGCAVGLVVSISLVACITRFGAPPTSVSIVI